MNTIQHDVDMEVCLVIVRHTDVLVLVISESFDRTECSVLPLLDGGPLSWLPAKLVVQDWVGQVPRGVLSGDCEHLDMRGLDAENTG
jgi:hypothetical protein